MINSKIVSGRGPRVCVRRARAAIFADPAVAMWHQTLLTQAEYANGTWRSSMMFATASKCRQRARHL